MRSSDANPVLVFSELNYADLLNAVTFMYKGSLTIAEENLDGFMQAAKVLQIKSIAPGYPIIPDPKIVAPDHSGHNSTSASSSSTSASSSSSSESESDRSVGTSTVKPIPTACQSSKETKKRSATKSMGSQPKKSTSSASPKSSVFRCVFCSKQFKTRKYTTRHQWTCSRNPNRNVFQCRSCPQTYTRKDRLAAHENKHDPAAAVPAAFKIGRK